MPDDIPTLRAEVAALRVDLKALQLEHRLLLRMVGVLPLDKDEPWPQYLSPEADCLAIRNSPLRIPIVMRADEDRAYIAFIDKNHRTRAELSIDDNGPRFEMHNAAGELTFQLAEAVDGSGQLCVCSKSGKPRAGMRVNESGGVVNVIDDDGKPQAFLLGTPEGGEIFVVNSMHRAGAALKATPLGGQVTVNEPSGQLMGFLFGTNEMGMLSVYGPHGAMAATLAGSEAGGRLAFNNLEGDLEHVLP